MHDFIEARVQGSAIAMSASTNQGPSGLPEQPKNLKDDDQAYLTQGQSVMETIPQDEDERFLARIGYRQVLPFPSQFIII